MIALICPVSGSQHHRKRWLPGRLTAVDHNTVRATVTVHGLSQKALRSREITVFAEPELYRVADAVDGTVEIASKQR